VDEQFEFLRLVVHRLDLFGVPYMLSGSVALSLYAEPRMTRDIDFVVDLEEGSVSSFVAAFSRDCYVDEEAVLEAVKRRGVFNIIHSEWVIKADFVVRKDAPFSKEEFERRVVLETLDFPLRVVTPEDLLLAKLKWAKDSSSELQQHDIVNLLRSQTALDWKYIGRWAGVLEVEELLETLRAAND